MVSLFDISGSVFLDQVIKLSVLFPGLDQLIPRYSDECLDVLHRRRVRGNDAQGLSTVHVIQRLFCLPPRQPVPASKGPSSASEERSKRRACWCLKYWSFPLAKRRAWSRALVLWGRETAAG